MNRGIEYYHNLERQYTKAAQEVEKEIAGWYSRLANNNGITMSEAKKLLSDDELKEFKWNVEEYIEKGRENNIDGRWMKELENASARVHINRLEAMKLQMQQQVEVLYGNELDSFDKFMRDTYTEGFYRSAFEIQRGLGVGTNLAKLDTDKINKVLSKPWAADGSNFSSRIWKQKNQLVNELHNGLTQAFIRGTDSYELTKLISNRFKVSKGQAGRLVMTETAYFHSAAQIDSFKELGVKEYEITAVLDSHTSEICRDMDGKHLPISEFKAGITAPPFHCWCRSTTVPYFNDEFTENETRIARGDDGKLYEVPYNMTYKQWEKAFVGGGSKDGLEPINEAFVSIGKTSKVSLVIKENDAKFVVENYLNGFATEAEIEKNTEILLEFMSKLDNPNEKVLNLYRYISNVINSRSKEINLNIIFAEARTAKLQPFLKDYVSSMALIIPKLAENSIVESVGVTLHEEMHLLDWYIKNVIEKNGAYFSESFLPLQKAIIKSDGSISKEIQELFDSYNKKMYDIRIKALDRFNTKHIELQNKYIHEGLWGKGTDYAKYHEKTQQLLKELDDTLDNESRAILGGSVGALEDIYDALSYGSYFDNEIVFCGHGSGYYKNTDKICVEILANYGELSVLRPDLVELLRKDKPNLVNALDEIIEEFSSRV